MLTAAQTTQNIEILRLESWVYGKYTVATLVNIPQISDSNLEMGRYSPQPGVSRIIWESWQHCLLNRPCHGFWHYLDEWANMWEMYVFVWESNVE